MGGKRIIQRWKPYCLQREQVMKRRHCEDCNKFLIHNGTVCLQCLYDRMQERMERKAGRPRLKTKQNKQFE